jgi:hypothetical protein
VQKLAKQEMMPLSKQQQLNVQQLAMLAPKNAKNTRILLLAKNAQCLVANAQKSAEV